MIDAEEYARKQAEEFLRAAKGRTWVEPYARAGGEQVEGYWRNIQAQAPKGAITGTTSEMQSKLADYFREKGVHFADARVSDIMRQGTGKYLYLWIKPRQARVKWGHLTSFKADAGLRVLDRPVRIGGVEVPGTGIDHRDIEVEINFRSPIRKRADGRVDIVNPKTTITEKRPPE